MKIAPLVIAGGVGLAVAAVALPLALKPQAPDRQATVAAAPSMKSAPPIADGQPMPANHPPIPGQTQAAPGGVEIHGTVLEVLDVPSYTYVRLNTSSEGELWAAIPKTQVKVGETLALTGTSRMDGFESPSLKRRFEKLVFANVAR